MTAATTLVHGAPGLGRHAPRPRARRRDRGRRGLPGTRRSAPGCRSSTAATRPAPTASCRSAAARSAAGRSTRSWTRRGRSAAAGLPRGHAARARTSTATATTSSRSRGSRTSTRPGRSGRRQDREGRPDLAELIRAIDGLRTADGAPAIPRLRFVTSHPWDLSDRLIEAMADCPSVCEALHLPVQSGSDTMLRRMGRQYTIEHYLERLGRIREARARDRALDRRHRRVLRRDRGRVRGDAPAARDRPLRPGVRGRLQRAARHAGDAPRRRRPAGREAAPARRAARRSRRASGWSATGRGWAGRRRSSSTRSSRRARHDHDDEEAAGTAESRDAFAHLPEGVAHLAGRSRENKLVHLAGSPALVGRPGRASGSTTRGPYALRGVARLTLAPLVVIGGPTATGKTGLAIALAERARRRRTPGRGRSPPTRGRSTAGWTSGRPRRPPRSGARVVHHGLDLVDPDQPYSAWPTSAPTRWARSGAGRARRDRDPRRRHRVLAAGGHGRASTPTRCRPTPACGPALEADLERDGVDALAARLVAWRRRSRRATDLRNPRRVVRALEIATLRGDAPLPGARRLPGAGPGPAAGRRARGARAAASPPAPAPSSTPASWRRREPCASAGTRRCRAFSAIGYRESWAVPRRRADAATQAIELDAPAQRTVRARQRTWFRREPALAVVDATGDPAPAVEALDRFLDALGDGPRRAEGDRVCSCRHEPPRPDRPRPARREGVPRGGRHRRRRRLDRRGQPDRARRARHHGGRRRRGRRVAEPPPRRSQLVRGQGQGRGAAPGQVGDRVRHPRRRRRAQPGPAEEPRVRCSTSRSSTAAG